MTHLSDEDALAEAREIIEQGWCQHALHKTAEGAITEGWSANRETSCALGAIELVAQDEEQAVRLQGRLQKGILKLRGVAPPEDAVRVFFNTSIPGFNDETTTTKEDVALAFKYAEEDSELPE